MAEAYELWKAMSVAGEDITFWQNIYVKFYQAFIEADRWKQYLEGMATTLYVTIIAILIGIVLGVIVASIRTAHDQQRRKKNIVLGFFNAICKIYVTVIRGTPMMVQLMILGFVVFKSSRNFTMSARWAWASTPAHTWRRSYAAASCRWTRGSPRPDAAWAWDIWTRCASLSCRRLSRLCCPPWATSLSYS